MDIAHIKDIWKVIPFDKFYMVEKNLYVFSVFTSYLINFRQAKTQSNYFKITECYITENICIGIIIEVYDNQDVKIRHSNSTIAVTTKTAKMKEFKQIEQLYTINLHNSYLIELISLKGAELLTVLPFKMNVSVL